MIRYSVIVPHFESPDVLPRAIASVPERADIEVLIIDNSQTPISSTLFSERKNVRILYSPYGKGAGAARNIGLENARGQWLVMLDADDFFTADAFATMDQYVKTEADIVFFYAADYDSESRLVNGRMDTTNILIDDYIQSHNDDGIRYGWSSPCAKMIRRSMVEEHTIRFDETHVANDMLFSVKTGYWAKRVEALPETIYCATIREGSLTQIASLSNLNGRIEATVRFNTFLKAHGIREQRKSIMYLVYTIARTYGYREAVKALCRSIRMGNNPFIGCTRWYKTAKRHD